jgi:hypothetical protein
MTSLKGLTYAEEDLIFETKPKMLSISTITISYETIPLLSVGVSEIRNNGESQPKQGILNQGAAKVVASTTKTE